MTPPAEPSTPHDRGDERRAGALAGRVVVVTGAGRGLGRAYALHAAAAGARVVVNDVDGDEARGVASEIERAGGAAVAGDHDISVPDQAGALMRHARDTFGALDGLVNNAGLYHEATPWEDDPERIARLIAVNVLGTLVCTTRASEIMRDQGTGGSIVNASSGGMFGFPHTSAYAASKGAIASATYAGALDLEQIGVRINAISPMALTRMTETALGRSLAPDGATRTPLDGIEEMAPERIAPLVTFLLSDRAAGITGQFLRFNGTRLSVVRQYPFAEHPFALDAEGFDVDGIERAFRGGPLAGALEPYGVERRVAPRDRS